MHSKVALTLVLGSLIPATPGMSAGRHVYRPKPSPPKDCTKLNGRNGYYGNPWCTRRSSANGIVTTPLGSGFLEWDAPIASPRGGSRLTSPRHVNAMTDGWVGAASVRRVAPQYCAAAMHANWLFTSPFACIVQCPGWAIGWRNLP